MFTIHKGYCVQVYKDAEHLTNPWWPHIDTVDTGAGHRTSRANTVARWYQMTRPLSPKKALPIAKAYQREGFLVRIVERTNNGTHVVKTLPQRRNRK